MDGFTYHNIFDTKGIEYLVIISFFLLLIPFWYYLNWQTKITRQRIKEELGSLTDNMLKVPQGLFFSRNHTWAHLEKSGIASIGLDDMMMHITGDVKVENIRQTGEIIKKGDLLAEMRQGAKVLKVFSPVSGEVIKPNTTLLENAEVLTDDPYGEGYLCKVKPFKWVEETNTYYLAENANEWSVKEMDRFRRFLTSVTVKYSADSSKIILQDGGEIRDQPLRDMPDKVWDDFQINFLNYNLT